MSPRWSYGACRGLIKTYWNTYGICNHLPNDLRGIIILIILCHILRVFVTLGVHIKINHIVWGMEIILTISQLITNPIYKIPWEKETRKLIYETRVVLLVYLKCTLNTIRTMKMRVLR